MKIRKNDPQKGMKSLRKKSVSTNIIFMLIIGGLLGVVNIISDDVAASDWDIETVDSEGCVGYFSSVALDSSGYPHISYSDWNDDALKYARWTGSTWNNMTVDSTGDVGWFTSIDLDDKGYPHISYWDVTNSDLKYAVWTGIDWNIETVDSTGDVGTYTSITLDSSGYAHISYTDLTNKDLKYARWTGSTWNIMTVDSVGSVGGFASIALDSSNYAHISYWDGTLDDLKYARWTGSTWNIMTVDSTGDVGTHTSIALDSSGYPHISYRDEANGNLKYARQNGISWSIETVDSADDVGNYTSIALDERDYPHISYLDNIYKNPKYARWSGSDWHIETVDPMCFFEGYTSIALDNNDCPHISYFSNFDLNYAKGHPPNQPPTCTISSPLPGQTISGIFEITGTASDSDGTVLIVEIKIDSDSWIEVSGTTSWSYNLDTKTLTKGEHTLYSRSYDGEDYSSKIMRNIEVDNSNQPPTCTISSPLSGETINGTVVISGSASDSDGTVQKVEIRIGDGPWIQVTSTTSWSYSLDTTELPERQHTIYARAYDGIGYSITQSISVNVNNDQGGGSREGVTAGELPLWVWLILILIIVTFLVLNILVARLSKKRRIKTMQEPQRYSPTYLDYKEAGTKSLPPPPGMPMPSREPVEFAPSSSPVILNKKSPYHEKSDQILKSPTKDIPDGEIFENIKKKYDEGELSEETYEDFQKRYRDVSKMEIAQNIKHDSEEV